MALRFGANDYGSLMMEENVVSAAGTTYRTTVGEMERNIRDAGFAPRRRRQDYSLIESQQHRRGMTRTGIGYDSHRFAPGRRLVLGGVTIPHPEGLAGHSDADVVAHALTDAILGAAGAGSIGALFPDTDPRWKDADSIALLREAYAHGAAARLHLRAVRHHRHHRGARRSARMPPPWPRASPAALGASPADVNVKAKTNEGMGFIGRREGMAAIAVATLERR